MTKTISKYLSMISVIIPIYNEKKHIKSILDQLVQIQDITCIYCVDDGSSDGSWCILDLYHHPKVCIISLEKNLWKSWAIAQALYRIDTLHVMLCDADIVDLDAKNIQMWLTYYFQNKCRHMLFKRSIDNPVLRLCKIDVLLTWERVYHTDDLRAIYLQNPIGYRLEIMSNMYFLRQWEILWRYPSYAKNTHKHIKYHFVVWIYKDMLMHYDIGTLWFLRDCLRRWYFAMIKQIR